MRHSWIWLAFLLSKNSAFAGAPAGSGFGQSNTAPFDVTFYVVADTHADATESYDLRALARIINTVGQGGVWPAQIQGKPTNFIGGKIAEPRGVVFVGDNTGWGVAPTEIQTFRRYFVAGSSAERRVSGQ